MAGKKKNLKFLVIGDLHGDIPKFHFNVDEVDAILCPGDICGDYIRSYIKKYIEERSKNLDEEIHFRKFCPKWKEFYLSKKSLIRGRKVLRYLNSFGKKVFLVPGNWDQTSVLDGYQHFLGKNKKLKDRWEKIKIGLDNIIDVDNRRVSFKGIDFIGHGATSAPEVLKRPIRSDFLDIEDYETQLIRFKFFSKKFKRLRRLFDSSKKLIILISHNAPYNTKLDKVYSPGTYAHNKHYGSILSRRLIDEKQPILNVSGHIHEGYGRSRIRKTICINSGFGGDVNALVEIDLNKNKVVGVKLIGENKA